MIDLAKENIQKKEKQPTDVRMRRKMMMQQDFQQLIYFEQETCLALKSIQLYAFVAIVSSVVIVSSSLSFSYTSLIGDLIEELVIDG